MDAPVDAPKKQAGQSSALQTYPHFATRADARTLAVQIIQRRDDTFGVDAFADVTKAFAHVA
ncbi:hypothetical protein DIE21_15200 [Burkholderia sp. Bp9140]|nr:hypothetical protein DIE21_15200 [Burkholderia sp. Bp9140]